MLRDELPDWQSQLAEKAPSTEVERVDPLTVIAVVSLILSVPPAIQSSWDLAQRIKLKEKIDRLIARAKARSAQGKIIPTVVLPHEGRAVPSDQAAPQQLLDAIASQSSPQRSSPYCLATAFAATRNEYIHSRIHRGKLALNFREARRSLRG